MKTNYVLIDFESVQVKSLALLTAEQFRVHVFLGPTNPKLPRDVVLTMHAIGSRAAYVELQTPGPNALDFHIAYYLGTLAATDPMGFFHIISKDTGFDPLIQHLKEKKIFVARSHSIEDMPCFKVVSAPTNGSAEREVASIGANGSRRLDELLKLVTEDLTKRKAAKPRTLKTLRSTILARIGKDAEKELDALVAALIQSGRVETDGVKVAYPQPVDG